MDMRRFLLSLCCIAALAACNTPSKEYILTGKLANTDATMGFIRVDDRSGEWKLDTVAIAADGTFEYRKQLAVPEMSFFMAGEGFYPMILVNGTANHLEADMKEPGKYKMTGDLEQEYKVQEKINQLSQEAGARNYASFKEWYEAYEADLKEVEAWVNGVPNRTYRRLVVNEFVGVNKMSFLTAWSEWAAAGKPLSGDADYSRYMDTVNMDNRSYLSSGLLGVWLEWFGSSVGGDTAYLKELDVADQKLKDAGVRRGAFMSVLGNYFASASGELLEQVYGKGKALFADSADLAWLTERYEIFQKLRPGAPAIDCAWEDPQGKTSRLSDLYGKVLYIDVWATWCGPCVAEIPHLEKLVERFKGNSRIEFVSVSVDSRKADWLAKLEKDKPQWKQFLCKDFCEFYNINGIPRFMLLDAAGNIITVDAPRPSDEHIDEFLKRYLK